MKVANTYCYPVRDKIAFVKNKDDLLMGFLLPNIFEHTLTHSSKRITSIEYMQNDVGRVDNLV